MMRRDGGSLRCSKFMQVETRYLCDNMTDRAGVACGQWMYIYDGQLSMDVLLIIDNPLMNILV